MTDISDKEIRERAENILERLSDLDNGDKFKVLIMAINTGIPAWEVVE